MMAMMIATIAATMIFSVKPQIFDVESSDILHLDVLSEFE